MDVAIIIVRVALLILVLLFIAAQFFYEFALNPSSRFSMQNLLRSGKVKEVNAEAFGLKDPETIAANEFFDSLAQSISVVAEDGKELLGWFIPAQTDSNKWAVICHGYTSHPKEMSRFAKHFHDNGFNAVLPAARAHERNLNTGAIQMGWHDSADLLKWTELIVLKDPCAHIVLFGISMGGAEVMMASGRKLPAEVKLIVEDCGYTSVWDEFEDRLKNMFHLPAFPLLNIINFTVAVRAGYNMRYASSLDMLQDAKLPILFIHGTNDAFVPFRMLDQCYEACASSCKEKLLVEGAGHGESAFKNPALYWAKVDAFIEKHL